MDKLMALLRKMMVAVAAMATVAVTAVATAFSHIGIRSKHTHKFLFEAYRPVKREDLLHALRQDGLEIPAIEWLLEGFRDLVPVSRFQNLFSGEAVKALIAAHLKWVAEIPANLVVTTGLTDIVDKYYKGSSYTAAHYCGLAAATPTFAAGNTMASHAGWTEVTAYDEATRPAITWGTVTDGSVDNSASKAAYTISTDATAIGGGFVTTNNTKGGSTGTLVGGAAFTGGNKTLSDGDTLNVTVTATATAS